MPTVRQLLLCFVALLLPVGGSATTLDFETLLNGESGGAGGFVFVTPEATVTIQGTGSNAGEAAFDTTDPGPNSAGPDPDLLVNTGIALILQNDNASSMTGNIFDTPNDDPNQNGLLTFVFSQAVSMVSIDLIDINGNGPATVTLFDSNGYAREYFAPMDWTGDPNEPPFPVGIETLDLTSLVPQVGPGPGNPSTTVTNDIGGVFNPLDVVTLTVEFDGSAALDNVSYIIPEPGTVGLLALGLAWLGISRRRR